MTSEPQVSPKQDHLHLVWAEETSCAWNVVERGGETPSQSRGQAGCFSLRMSAPLFRRCLSCLPLDLLHSCLTTAKFTSYSARSSQTSRWVRITWRVVGNWQLCLSPGFLTEYVCVWKKKIKNLHFNHYQILLTLPVQGPHLELSHFVCAHVESICTGFCK